MHHPTVSALVVGLLSALPGAQAGMYTKKSPVVQVDAKSYDRLIAKSNFTSIVEFYAPWCGHCKNLKPAYEKAAKNLEGLAKVAAIDCDDDSNKAFCGQMGVQGFPTLKIVRPRQGGGKPVVEDYQGQRTATAIVEAVTQRMNNHVKRVEDKNIDSFLSEKNETAKALIFTDKGVTSALLKALATDFLDVITIGIVRSKGNDKTVEMFGIEKSPTVVLLPGGDADSILYDGEIKKDALAAFLSQAGEPNPDPAPVKPKADKKDKKASSSKTTSSEAEASTESATQAAPVIVESAIPIPIINTKEKLIKECLTEKSHTCVLAFVPSESEDAKEALQSLADLAFKHSQSKRHLFPFFEVSKDNEGAADLLKALDLSGDVEVIAINARRGWWRRFEGASFGHENIESWIDAIRMSEGVKKKLPEGIVAIAVEEPVASEAASSSAEPEPTPKEEEPVEKPITHEEL